MSCPGQNPIDVEAILENVHSLRYNRICYELPKNRANWLSIINARLYNTAGQTCATLSWGLFIAYSGLRITYKRTISHETMLWNTGTSSQGV